MTPLKMPVLEANLCDVENPFDLISLRLALSSLKISLKLTLGK